MKELLMKIALRYIFLFKEYNFRFVNSEYIHDLTGSITISNIDIQITFVVDYRDGYNLLIKPCFDSGEDWSLYYISKIIDPKSSFENLYSRKAAKYLHQNYSKIIELFSVQNYEKTVKDLKQIKEKDLEDFISNL